MGLLTGTGARLAQRKCVWPLSILAADCPGLGFIVATSEILLSSYCLVVTSDCISADGRNRAGRLQELAERLLNVEVPVQ